MNVFYFQLLSNIEISQRNPISIFAIITARLANIYRVIKYTMVAIFNE